MPDSPIESDGAEDRSPAALQLESVRRRIHAAALRAQRPPESVALIAVSKTFDGDQWVRAEVIVLGSGPITHIVNGETVLEYSLPQYGGLAVNDFDPAAKPDGELIEGGYLALQSESHPIEFRKVELLNLAGCMDRKARNYKSYYVKSERTQCQYGAQDN